MHRDRPGGDAAGRRRIAFRAIRVAVAAAAGAVIVAVVRVQVSVHLLQQLVVMRVRRDAVGVVRVVHAGLLAGAVLAGVAEAEDVADLLAHDVALLVGVGPVRGIAVIDFRRALVDVAVRVEADRGQAEPAVEAVGGVADAHLAGDHLALLAGAVRVVGRVDGHVEDARHVPLVERGVELELPVGRHAVDDLERQRVGAARPVVVVPGVARIGGGGEHGHGDQAQDEDPHGSSLHLLSFRRTVR